MTKKDEQTFCIGNIYYENDIYYIVHYCFAVTEQRKK